MLIFTAVGLQIRPSGDRPFCVTEKPPGSLLMRTLGRLGRACYGHGMLGLLPYHAVTLPLPSGEPVLSDGIVLARICVIGSKNAVSFCKWKGGRCRLPWLSGCRPPWVHCLTGGLSPCDIGSKNDIVYLTRGTDPERGAFSSSAQWCRRWWFGSSPCP